MNRRQESQIALARSAFGTEIQCERELQAAGERIEAAMPSWSATRAVVAAIRDERNTK